MTCLLVASATVLGCGAADSGVDPGDLELRDLLGVSPGVAAGWDATERARARTIIALASGRASEEPAEPVRLGLGTDEREAIIASMSAVDEQRRELGREPVVVAWVLVEHQQVEVLPVSGERVNVAMASASGPGAPDPSSLVLDGWEQATRAGWDELAQRQPGLLASLARQAGYRDEPVPLPVIPAPQEPFAVIFVDAGAQSFLAVNPVLLAAQEPGASDGEGIAFARPDAPGAAPGPRAPVAVGVPVTGGAPADTARAGDAAAAATGNPYSFYGSINECAAFQRQRCQACATDTSCETVTRDAESVASECEALSADDERGYYLLCINLALAMATVADCADDTAQCPQASNAGNQLSALAFNAVFLDDTTCAGALDSCLSDIFGAPEGDFPGPGSPEPPDPPPPPRDTNLSCGDSNVNCDFSPSCSSSCSVGSCDNALSCGGCEGASCEGCESCDSSGGGGGSGGSSGCDDGGGGGGGGSSGCEGGGCEGGGCDSGCAGGGCDSGGCEGGSCSGGSDSCSSSCSVTRRQGNGQTALALLWVLAPCVFLEYRRRRERRRPGQEEAAL